MDRDNVSNNNDGFAIHVSSHYEFARGVRNSDEGMMMMDTMLCRRSEFIAIRLIGFLLGCEE